MRINNIDWLRNTKCKSLLIDNIRIKNFTY